VNGRVNPRIKSGDGHDGEAPSILNPMHRPASNG
jgi:hypothetical protein